MDKGKRGGCPCPTRGCHAKFDDKWCNLTTLRSEKLQNRRRVIAILVLTLIRRNTYGAVSLKGEEAEADERVAEHKLCVEFLSRPDEQSTYQH